ncbi:BTB/POZ domain-containing protein 6-B-like [Rhopilema esculentum]|uniref:BTB/POZ domain-containing protein 6-B-like n=1 Tax=Rhopilema esculentum TaxID=499914 RepID=UPI0031DF62BD|eukprot:gene6894-12503_t
MAEQWLKRLSLKIANNFLNEELSDFALIVNEGKFPVHKFVLASESPVFKAMLYGPLAKKEQQEVEIVDCDSTEALEEFLRLIYKGEASLTWDNARCVSYLVDKYMIESTGNVFRTLVASNIGTYNSLDFLEKSLLDIGHDDMVDECLKIVRKDISVLVRTERFLDLHLKSLKVILASKRLDISEIDLFHAVNKWCLHQISKASLEGETKSKKEVLGDALYLIRFPTISMDDLTRFCVTSKLITTDHFYELARLKTMSSQMQQAELDEIPFPKHSRTRGVLAIKTKYTLSKIEDYPFYFIFKVNKRVYLKGFIPNEGWKPSGSKQVEIGEVDVPLTVSETDPLVVFFKEPVLVDPSSSLKLSLHYNNPKSTVPIQSSNFPRNSPSLFGCPVYGRYTTFTWHDFEFEIWKTRDSQSSPVNTFLFSIFDGKPMIKYSPELCSEVFPVKEATCQF